MEHSAKEISEQLRIFRHKLIDFTAIENLPIPQRESLTTLVRVFELVEEHF